MAKVIHVVGAGLSGLVASIALRTKGYRVIVHEKEKNIGEYFNYHPSLHVTPFDYEFLKNLTGIDFSRNVKPMKRVVYFFEDRKYEANASAFSGIERSSRPTSIDTFLFNIAKKEGVEFVFNEKNIKIKSLPNGSIIATGLNPEGFTALNVPFRRVWGFAFKDEVKDENYEGHAFTWFASFTDDYAYGACLNNLRYFLLFSTFRKITEEELKKFKETVMKHLNIKLGDAVPTAGAIPIASSSNPRLFQDGKILAGTLSGTMEPSLLFGIHGAITSGAIAAMAVDEPERALEMFKKINKQFRKIYLLRRWGEYYPKKLRQFILELVTKYPRLHYPWISLMGRGIPGYRENWTKKVLHK